MEEKNADVQESLNSEGEQNTNSESEPSKESNEELVKVKKNYEDQKVRAEKAEKENKELKAQLESQTPKKRGDTETPKKEEQSNEPDYYKDLTLRTYLKGEGVDNKEDQDWLLKESKEIKKPVEDLLSKPYYQSELKTRVTQREAEAGMPEGSGSGKGAGGAKNTVEYWLNKKNKDGTYVTPDDLKLAEKVINAREARDAEGNKFSDVLYTG